jgi:PAS domain S-box-containing protein
VRFQALSLPTQASTDGQKDHERLENERNNLVKFHSILDSVYFLLVRVHDRDELFGEICRTVVGSGLFLQAWVGLVDPATMVVRRVASTSEESSNFDQFCVSADESAGEGDHEVRAIMSGQSFFCNDIESDPRHMPWRMRALQLGFRSCACIPLKLGKRLIGVLKLYSGDAEVFGESEILILERLGTAISTRLAASRQEEHRRRAEQELRESEGRYRRVVENMIGLVSQMDARRIFQFVSPSCRAVLHYDPEQLLGKSFLEFVHTEDADSADFLFKSAEKDRSTAKVELRFRRADNQYLWLEMAVDPIFDEFDKLQGFMCASRSIGERKEAEEKLRRYTENLEKLVRERTETIRILNETTTQRLIQKIGQIDHISEIRDGLKKSQGLQSSCESILESAMRDLGMSVGVIFTIEKAKHVAEVQAFRTVDGTVNSKKAFSLDTKFVEYECLAARRPTSRVVASEPSVLGVPSLHCSPILFMNEPVGVLALGRKTGERLDESDLSVLRLYSGLVTTVLETTSLSVEPTRETCRKREAKYKLGFGSNYLVVDSIDLAYDMFADTIMTGTEGLCITRKLPRKLRETYGLKRTPIIWLTSEKVENERTINSLQDLSILISNYVDKAEKPLILIDGIEYLVSHQGFDSVYHFLQAKGTQVEAAEGIMIIPFFKETFEPRQVKLLEREFNLFKHEEKDV